MFRKTPKNITIDVAEPAIQINADMVHGGYPSEWRDHK
jgi:hypothetical protein